MIERNYEYLKKFKPFIIENGGQQYVSLSKKKIEAISSLTVQAGRCLGVKRGTIKGDIVIHKGTPYIIELATRLSGGWMSSDQIPLATGVNIIKIAIKIALGEHVNIDEIKIKKKIQLLFDIFFQNKINALILKHLKSNLIDTLKNINYI